MLRYLLKRLLIIIPTFFGIMVLSFLVIKLAPGDHASLKYGQGGGGEGNMNADRGTEAAEKRFRERWHLDKSLPVQFYYFMERLATLDLTRYRPERPITKELGEKLMTSAKLNLFVFALIYILAVPLGIYSAANPQSLPDRASAVFLFMLYSMPSFWVAEILRDWFCSNEAIAFGFPISGLHSDNYESLGWWGQFKDYLWHIVLPVTCMAYGGMAYISRQMRAGMLEVVQQDYIRTARAKGCSKTRTILVHALRNGLFPIITLFASLLPFLVSGSVIIEYIFNIDGIGRYAFQAVVAREYDIVMATLLLSAIMTLFGILLSDIMYVLVNPRVSFDDR